MSVGFITKQKDILRKMNNLNPQVININSIVIATNISAKYLHHTHSHTNMLIAH